MEAAAPRTGRVGRTPQRVAETNAEASQPDVNVHKAQQDKQDSESAPGETFEDMLRRPRDSEKPIADFARTEDLLPELFIAIARPQGTNDSPVRKAMSAEFRLWKYHVETVRLAVLIRRAGLSFVLGGDTLEYKERKGYRRIHDLMSQGDNFRAVLSRSAVAEFAIIEIQRRRPEAQAYARDKGFLGIVYLISSVVHPSEVALLRTVYKQRFFLVGIHQSYQERLRQLERIFRRDGSGQNAKADAIEILEIDAGLRASQGSISDASLNIDATFHKADVFLRAMRSGLKTGTSNAEYKQEVVRWLDQMFGFQFGAPTVDEYGMANAYIAAKQSVALGRSVGAAILSVDGQVLSQGWNEPAQPGGGVGREGRTPDLREHHDGFDSSDVFRIEAITEFLTRLIDRDANDEFAKLNDVRGVDSRWVQQFRNATKELPLPTNDDVRIFAAVRALSSARLMNLIEFGRSVHAEMAAIAAAACRGISIMGSTLYVTTFPCHECARNIVAAGIARVVYVEPYGKSLAYDLYSQSINVTSQEDGRVDEDRVTFQQFTGLAPSVHETLFSTLVRKHSLETVATAPSISIGEVIDWTRGTSSLRPSIRGYIEQNQPDPFFEVARMYAESSIADGLRLRIKEVYPGNVDRE